VLPTSLNLALLVVQRELVDLMPNIGSELEQLVLNYKNQAIAEVTTATKLDDAQMDLIKQALERRTGKTILVETKVQPEILGGVIARVGDRIIDGSIRYRLSALRQQLLAGAASSNTDFLSGIEDGQGAAAADTLVTPGGNPQEETAEPSRLQSS
jgi:F-type H+-transporting ATPase subunit delta